jgi:hypothetical protein
VGAGDEKLNEFFLFLKAVIKDGIFRVICRAEFGLVDLTRCTRFLRGFLCGFYRGWNVIGFIVEWKDLEFLW